MLPLPCRLEPLHVGGIDLALAPISALDADDAIPANRDVARLERTGDQVEDASTLDNEIGHNIAEALVDGARQKALVM